MSYANGTQFYNLPQTVGTDKRDWFDANAAFAAVDAALHAAATGQAADAEAIAAINTSLAADEANIASLQTASTTHSSEISGLQATVASQGTAISDVRQDAEDMISAFNEGAASVSTHAYTIGDYFIYNDVLYKATAAIAIGDTIVPNTNCSATNVTSEIKVINADIDEVKSDLTDLETNVSKNKLENSSVVNLFNYSSSNKYTAPSDGYVCIGVNTASGYGAVIIQGSNEEHLFTLNVREGYEAVSVFVRKGMKIYPGEASAVENLTCEFIALT
jgi:hypothetical protein